MSDNWNLKGKKKIIDTKFYEVNPVRGVTTVNAYLAEDIETLRKKLINDIEGIFYGEFPPSHIESIKDIINKRFEIEE